MNLPKQTVQQKNESDSYAIILYYLRSLGIFRNVTQSDYGIDFDLELVVAGKVTGKYLKIQVKSSDDLYIRKKDGIPTVGNIKQSTLWYWAEISQHTNVVLFAVDLKSERIYTSKPLFWQVIKLMDKSESSKTIECLDLFKDTTDELEAKDFNLAAATLTIRHFFAPPIRNQTSMHTSMLRGLRSFIQFYSDVFHYDSHLPIEDTEIFRQFLELSKDLFWTDNVANDFQESDRKHWHSYQFWHNKNQSDAPLNIDCQTPMRILMPHVMRLLLKLRSDVIDGGYYWLSKNPEYFKMVTNYRIPDQLDHDDLLRMPETGDPFELLDESKIYDAIAAVNKKIEATPKKLKKPTSGS